MIKWFKKNWNEPFTVGTCLQMCGWMTLLSLLLVYPVCILSMYSFIIVDRISNKIDDIKEWFKTKVNKTKPDECVKITFEEDFED